MTTLSQRSFAGGEITPSLYARCDTVKYGTGLRTMRNFILMRHGGAASRPGSRLVCEVKDSSKRVRLIRFEFNAEQTYMLEFGEEYMRVIRQGVQLTDLTLTITGVTNANPAVVSYTGTDPVNGQEVQVSGIVGAIGTYLNNRNFKIANVNGGANTFELDYMDGSNVNSTAFGAYTSGGTALRVYEIETPYAEGDLPDIQFVQSADVITLVHPGYPPMELSRTGHTSWTLTTAEFVPDTARPNGGYYASITAGANTYKWRVTAIDPETGEESLPGYEASLVISAATQASPVVVTAVGQDYQEGDEVFITGVVGMDELNDRKFIIKNEVGNTFELFDVDDPATPIDGTGYSAYVSGGTVAGTYIRVDNAAVGTPADPNEVHWVGIPGIKSYNVYRAVNGVFGYLGTADTDFFEDIGNDPDVTDTPPSDRNPFVDTGNYPSAVTYYQQRLGFANTDLNPEKIYFSRSGMFHNFTVSAPIQDDDAVTFTMAGRQVNEVRHMLDLGRLLVLTTGGEHAIFGDAAGVLKPGEVSPRQLSYNGSSVVAPIVIGTNALYIQARGSIVRDFTFDEIKGSTGTDLTIFSAHLFDGYQIMDWAYQQIPHSIAYSVRDDGILLGLTYVREQELIGWHRHDTDGLYENVSSIPNGDEDTVYTVVNRVIDGSTKRFIEYFETRRVDDIRDYVGGDSTLSYDGRNTSGTTMTLSGGTTWSNLETLTLTASTSFFTAADVGNAVFLNTIDGDIIRFSILAYSSGTVVTGSPHKIVPVGLRNAATLSWSKAVDEVTGLWHLEDKDVVILGDGNVVASPNNPSNVVYTVSNGSVTLDRPYAVIHVGLPITCDIETLDIDSPNAETLADKKKIVQSVTIHVEKSRGIWVAAKAPDSDAIDLDLFNEVKIRDEEGYEDPVSLATGTVDVNINGQWNSNGRIFIRQVDPIPLSVLAVSPAGMFPFRKLGG